MHFQGRVPAWKADLGHRLFYIRFMFAFVYNPSPMKTTIAMKLFWLTFYCLPLIGFAANFTEPRPEVTVPQSSAISPMPVKVIIYKGRREQPTSPSRGPAISAKPHGGPTAQEVKAYVRSQAMEFGVNPLLALWIVKHESQFNPRARGDGESEPGGYGRFQRFIAPPRFPACRFQRCAEHRVESGTDSRGKSK